MIMSGNGSHLMCDGGCSLAHHAQTVTPMVHRNNGSLAVCRRGHTFLWLLVILAGAVSLTGLVAYSMSDFGQETIDSSALVYPVIRRDFHHYITTRGDVESTESIEIRCRVKSDGGPGVPILQICSEGEIVAKGDLLVQFDDSLFRNQLMEQQIVVSQAEALVIQAKSDLRAAEIALEEYVGGTFKQESTLIESEIFVARENLRRSQDYLTFSRLLVTKGYLTHQQLEADRFSVDKARTDLRAAQKKRSVHQEYAYKKMVAQLESAVEKQMANVKVAEHTRALGIQKRDEIQEQIDHCRVLAPQDGLVLYASQTDGRGEEAIIIEEGTVIRQGQPVIRMPMMSEMRVAMRVSQNMIVRIQQGKPALVYLDTNPHVPANGRVTFAASFPYPRRRNYEPIEYRAVVEVFDPPRDMRPGLRAEVKIFVAAQPDALQVPLPAVFVDDNQSYCMVKTDDGSWHPRKVDIGPNNDKYVVVREGLQEGDLVAINPRDFLESLKLPAVSEGPDNLREDSVAARKHSPSRSPNADAAKVGRTQDLSTFSQILAHGQ